jgi:aminopeptidase
MDPRVERHAEIIVDHCIEAKAGDNVLVKAPACADNLVVTLNHYLGAVGARPLLNWLNRRANRAYLRAVDPDDCVLAEHELALMEAADAMVIIDAHENASEHSDSPAEARQAIAKASQPIRDAVPDRKVYTRYPGTGDARKAEMSTDAYEEYVWSAVNKDWEARGSSRSNWSRSSIRPRRSISSPAMKLTSGCPSRE